MKDIPEYEGLYAVTEDGRVWSHERYSPCLFYNPYGGKRKQGFVEVGGYFLKSSIGDRGYPVVNLRKNGAQKVCTIHRLVALTHLRKVEGKNHINHKNGIKTDNKIENLEWCTSKENSQHAWKTGLATSHEGKRGIKNNKAILTENEVLEIRRLYPTGMTLKQLGSKFNVSFRTIWDIIKRRHWTHI